jgi:hypothetical protein
VRLDQNPAHAPDILASIPPLPPAVLDTRWDVIELIHGIEHFWLWDVKLLLTGIHSALASGGTLVLEQPNITVAARILAGVEPSTTPELIQSTMWPLYGDPAHRDEGYMHRWGYTPDTLVALLKECAPWSSITVLPQQYHTYARGRDFRVEAVR